MFPFFTSDAGKARTKAPKRWKRKMIKK
jgi:hypothetical protein